MRLIEKTLPVQYLNSVAMAEGNAKKPVYRMHKWWARRLGSVFRAILLSTFSASDESESSIWHRFCEGADLQGRIVLDPFMGGGTTVVEALRLGCRVVGADINPVAWFITKKEVEPVDIEPLDSAFQHLETTVGSFIKHYYQTRCLCGRTAEVMYFFWVKVAECPECQAKVRLFPNHELSHRDHNQVSFCPHCLQVIETEEYSPVTTCPECQRVFDPRKGVAGRGMFVCPKCGTKDKILDAVRRGGTKLDEELHALEGYCAECGRFFKRVDDADQSLFEKAKSEFNSRKHHLLIPSQFVPVEGRSDPRPVNHGYRYFWQMFNERQLLCLSTLLEAIMDLTDPNVREMMLLAFSDCLDTNTMFCKYEVRWHKISPFFGLHAYHPIERPTENNVWGTVYGRGTFTKCFKKVRRGKEFCQTPYERLLDIRGKRYSKRTGKERISANLVGAYDDLAQGDHTSVLVCGNSEDLSFLPDNSIEAVITDPPYFDNVQYSELADFFYVWLRLALKDVYPWFQPDLSSRSAEIIQNEKAGKTLELFNRGLERVFTECHRVLKDDGVLVFTFHHNKAWAWSGIARILSGAGFYISASPIVRSEGKSGFHSSEGNIRYDAVLVCRKQAHQWQESSSDGLTRRVLTDAVNWARRTLESGMAINQVDIFTIVMAKSIEHMTKSLTTSSPKEQRLASIDGFLAEMQGFLDSVSQEAGREVEEPPGVYTQEARQLALLLEESALRYGKSGGIRV